jgi:tetratricopeptide (TPR) repeat protein
LTGSQGLLQSRGMDATAPSPSSLFFEGNDRLAAGDLPGAAACYRAALSLDPALGEAHANLGWALAALGRRQDADASYRRALSFAPRHLAILLNYGAFLAEAKRFEMAEALLRRALAVEPDSAAAWSNLAVLYAQMARFDESEACCYESLSRDPHYAKARGNLAYLCLRQGRFTEGWSLYESRAWRVDLSPHVDAPRWTGEPLAGKAVLIAPEGGHGDAIQFARYAIELKRRGAKRVALLCTPPLVRLLQTLDGVDELLTTDQPLERSGWDHWVSLMSLPALCGTRAGTIPVTRPYLRAHARDVARWQPQLPTGGVRAGLVWKGNPSFENDDERSLPSLHTLEPLAGVAGVRFVSLQKGAGEDEARQGARRLQPLPLGASAQHFADTAALIDGLDLVVSVDTAVAHLAAAMGKPCWVLLPHHMPDWRWMAERGDSPWYPGCVRLFRQPARGDWATVVAQAKGALVDFVARSAAPRRHATAATG